GKVVKEWEGYPASMSTQSLINDIDAVINSKQ
ncbi:MAG TPA: thiol-disulfide isomerase, partial [Runella sp.]|nr:thiol-disulfide isomerase [Runella sp.]